MTLGDILNALNFGLRPAGGAYGPPDTRGRGPIDAPRIPTEPGSRGAQLPEFKKKLEEAERQYQRDVSKSFWDTFYEGVKGDLKAAGIYIGLVVLIVIGLLFVGIGGKGR